MGLVVGLWLGLAWSLGQSLGRARHVVEQQVQVQLVHRIHHVSLFFFFSLFFSSSSSLLLLLFFLRLVANEGVTRALRACGGGCCLSGGFQLSNEGLLHAPLFVVGSCLKRLSLLNCARALRFC